jgi:hypothetical protein
MWHRAMPSLKLPITIEQFHQLPQNPAYKYEYFDNYAFLSPRPETFHAVLELRALAGAALDGSRPLTRLRPLADADWAWMPRAFAAAFRHLQPFGSLDEGPRLEVARGCLERTRSGGDGPLIQSASFVALAGEDAQPAGALLVTLIPDADPTGFDICTWSEPPPPDCLQRRLGRPHLTWVFVNPWHERLGLGTALLRAAVRELLALGYAELASTFLLGNHLSMLWHWRIGFRLLPYGGSQRAINKMWEREGEP